MKTKKKLKKEGKAKSITSIISDSFDFKKRNNKSEKKPSGDSEKIKEIYGFVRNKKRKTETAVLCIDRLVIFFTIYTDKLTSFSASVDVDEYLTQGEADFAFRTYLRQEKQKKSEIFYNISADEIRNAVGRMKNKSKIPREKAETVKLINEKVMKVFSKLKPILK